MELGEPVGHVLTPSVSIFYMAGVTCMICNILFTLQPQLVTGALGRIAIASQHCRQSVAATATSQSRGTRFPIPTNDEVSIECLPA